MTSTTCSISYTPPAPAPNTPAKHLIVNGGGPDEQRYTFFDRVEIRRRQPDSEPGVVAIDDPTVSSRHCVITQTHEGLCFVRDVSRNGTRLDGRRLVPNIEVEITPGQVLSVGHETQLVLGGESASAKPRSSIVGEAFVGTTEEVESRRVTVLVGDIRDYTILVQEAPATALQASVSRLFERLDREVVRHGGTVKEHQGDALFAFWEVGMEPHAIAACRAALALDRLVKTLAADRDVWTLHDFPLRMEWALTTGPVLIHSFGGAHPTGLSVVGEPVVLAFRMEKLAGDETGPIVACPVTREEAGGCFLFDNRRQEHIKGFERPIEVCTLRGPM